MNLNTTTKLAIKAAIEAGKEILKIYHSSDIIVEYKEDDSPLTRADIAAHDIIKEYLSETSIPLLSEEGKAIPYNERKDWKKLWIIDPIDGTKEFIKRNGEFTVNIALVENQIPIMGIIYAPALGDLYFSQETLGAFKVKVDLEQLDIESLLNKASKLPTKGNKNVFTVVASRSHMSPETALFVEELRSQYSEVNLVSKGSSLKLCMVAEGTANCYPRFAPTMEWDTAAGQAICMHAGFDVIAWNTKKNMLYNKKELMNNWFLVK